MVDLDTQTTLIDEKNDSSPVRMLLGYADKLTVRPGEKIAFKVSSKQNVSYVAQLVRLINGDTQSELAHFKEIEIPSSINGNYIGRQQVIACGSCIVIEKPQPLDALNTFTLAITFMPTTPTIGKQHLISRWHDNRELGWSLQLNDKGRLAFVVCDTDGNTSTIVNKQVLKAKYWYHAVVRTCGVTKTIQLDCIPLTTTTAQTLSFIPSVVSGQLTGEVVQVNTNTPLLMAAAFGGYGPNGQVIPKACFNGRLEAPIFYHGVLTDFELASVLAGKRPKNLNYRLIADWDFSHGMDGIHIKDCSPNKLHGRTYNLPLRAIKGSNWDGSVMDWKSAPNQYAAIHFHCDDLYDCAWLTDINYQIPDNLGSGIYAVRLRQQCSEETTSEYNEEYIPFFVAAPKKKPRAKLALLLPTFTYLAYGNFSILEKMRRKSDVPKEHFYPYMIMGPGTESYAVKMTDHCDLGASTYDEHLDGSPVHFSSWLRPLLNMRPKTFLWTLGADLLITDWLEAKGLDYDIITDDLLQEEGAALLKDYTLVMSGNHPEYPTTEQLDAIQAYTEQGGRFMYMGGNGYYWRSATHTTLPGVIEVRRGRIGTGSWKSEVGESYMALTGELGGMWREIDRPPQQLFGVGFIAQGGPDGASYYHILPEARESRAAFILQGIDDEIIGDFGIFKGAAGQEIDQTNPAYGTPSHTIVLARSENHNGRMDYVIEEKTYETSPEICLRNTYAEVVFFETLNGGAMFSVGSMAWVGSLSHQNYNNNVSKITENVVRRFIDEEPFEYAITS